MFFNITLKESIWNEVDKIRRENGGKKSKYNVNKEGILRL